MKTLETKDFFVNLKVSINIYLLQAEVENVMSLVELINIIFIFK